MTSTPRLIPLVALALLLAACAPTRPVASLERAAALAARGDHPAAAREYEAVGSSTAESLLANPAWINAARQWLRAADPAAAERALARLSPPLEAPLTLDRDLLLAEAALQSAQPLRGWELLSAISPLPSADRLDAYHALRQQLALATHRPLQAIRSQLERDNLAASNPERLERRREFLALLQQALERGIPLDPRTAGRDTHARGWLEAAPLALRAAAASIEANAAITAAWRKRHPDHPAYAALTSLGLRPAPTPAPAPRVAGSAVAAPAAAGAATATGVAGAGPAAAAAVPSAVGGALWPSATPLPPTPHVAVLLPLSGRSAALGAQLREGILSAQLAEPRTSRRSVRFYDTARQPATEALRAAAAAGADFIIGPLAREDVLAVAAEPRPAGAPALLALNFLPPDFVPPAAGALAGAAGSAAAGSSASGFWQFALSPEDEARAVARRALGEGKRRAVALVPAGEWGTRVLAAFRDELQAGGGVVLASATLGPGDTAATLREALRIDDSIARHRRIQAVTDTPLAFTPRRRGDLDFLFTPAPSAALRDWRAQLRFQGAGDLPAFATSDAYDGRAGAELAGLVFPDMDWMIAPQAPVAAALRASVQAAFGEVRGRGRLFAFGHDAWLLQRALRAGVVPSVAAPLNGATGGLWVAGNGQVQRSLRWALIDRDTLELLADGR